MNVEDLVSDDLFNSRLGMPDIEPMPEWQYKHSETGGDWKKAFGGLKSDVVRELDITRTCSIFEGKDLSKRLIPSPSKLKESVDNALLPSFRMRIVWVQYLTFKDGFGFTSHKRFNQQSMSLGYYRFSTPLVDFYRDELVEKFRDALAALSSTHTISSVRMENGRQIVNITMLPSNMFDSNIDVDIMERLPLVLEQVEEPRNDVVLSKLNDNMYFDLMSYLEDEHVYWQHGNVCTSFGVERIDPQIIMFGELKDASLQAKIDEVTGRQKKYL